MPTADGLAGIDTHPDHVVGTGTSTSCTSQAVVDAVALGGVITFNCGPGRVTIVMTATAKVVNTSPIVVLDGGGKVTLSGAGQRRILYMNTCDKAQIWTTSHCEDQDQPQLNRFTLDLAGSIVHNNTANEGGGAIFFVSNDRTGELRITTSVLERNVSRGFETRGFPGIFFLGLGAPQVVNSTLT